MLYDAKLKVESLKTIKDKLYTHNFNTVDGNSDKVIAMSYTTENDIDVFLPGYIVTEDGIVLPVVYGDTHPNVALNYFKKYYGSKWNDIKLQGKSYLDLIIENNAIMYIGPRTLEENMDGREVMVLTKVPPFMLSDKQIDFLSCLEKAVALKNCKLSYHGNGMSVYDNLLPESELTGFNKA